MKALEKRPDQRWTTAHELVSALEAAIPEALDGTFDARVADYMASLLGARGAERRWALRAAQERLDQSGDDPSAPKAFSLDTAGAGRDPRIATGRRRSRSGYPSDAAQTALGMEVAGRPRILPRVFVVTSIAAILAVAGLVAFRGGYLTPGAPASPPAAAMPIPVAVPEPVDPPEAQTRPLAEPQLTRARSAPAVAEPAPAPRAAAPAPRASLPKPRTIKQESAPPAEPSRAEGDAVQPKASAPAPDEAAANAPPPVAKNPAPPPEQAVGAPSSRAWDPTAFGGRR
jgi:hypothetical protein